MRIFGFASLYERERCCGYGGKWSVMQPVPGTAPKPGPLALPADRLLHRIGYRPVELDAGAAATHDVTLG